jgi:hypothetical protein
VHLLHGLIFLSSFRQLLLWTCLKKTNECTRGSKPWLICRNRTAYSRPTSQKLRLLLNSKIGCSRCIASSISVEQAWPWYGKPCFRFTQFLQHYSPWCWTSWMLRGFRL